MGNLFTTFVNCRLCIAGHLVPSRLVVSQDTGDILESTGYIGGDIVDLEDAIVAPGFLDLHVTGTGDGFGFSVGGDARVYRAGVERTARGLVESGVTGFWALVDGEVEVDGYYRVSWLPFFWGLVWVVPFRDFLEFDLYRG
jgi:N-acetylglucosamine-6-phosphate deacetylase